MFVMNRMHERIRVRLYNPRTGIAIYPLEPGDPDYEPESEAFVKALMEAEAGDERDLALKQKLNQLADEWGERSGQ